MLHEQAELDLLVRGALKSQYRAALGMLREGVELCPESEWEKGNPAFWQVAYHTLFFAHFYMGRDEAAFRSWGGHQAGWQSLDLPRGGMGETYGKEQVLEYLTLCEGMVDSAVDALDLLSGESGFAWYKVSKVEHQIINIRHIQHHAVYLSAALKGAGLKGASWISPMRSEG